MMQMFDNNINNINNINYNNYYNVDDDNNYNNYADYSNTNINRNVIVRKSVLILPDCLIEICIEYY